MCLVSMVFPALHLPALANRKPQKEEKKRREVGLSYLFPGPLPAGCRGNKGLSSCQMVFSIQTPL